MFRQILVAIGVVLGLLLTCWGGFTYLEKYALCEDMKIIDRKADKMMEMYDKKIDANQRLTDYKFLTYELKTVESRIYDKEKEIAENPRNETKRVELERLKRERDDTLRRMLETRELK